MAEFDDKSNGNTVDATEYNSIVREVKNSILDSDQTLNGSDDHQVAKGMANYAAVSTFYSDSGSANVYTLVSQTNFNSPTALKNGLLVRFRPANTNTGPSTIQLPGTTAKAAKKADKTTDVTAGDISTATDAVFRYDSVADVWVLNSSASSSGFANNLLINPSFSIDQRNVGAAQTITAGAALAYTVDRWYAYCTGANVTGQRVAGTAPDQYNYRFTGTASVTKIGFAQRIEAANSQHLAGSTATLSVYLANSLLTTVTWTAWYANTTDTFGTLASPTRTQIATGTFTVTSSLTRYNTSISIPSAATTGVEIEFSVAAQTSGTWTIGKAQLELGAVATPFEYNLVSDNLLRCQRYYEKSYDVDTAPGAVTTNGAYNAAATSIGSLFYTIVFKITKRTTPTITIYSPNSGASGNLYQNGTGDVPATGNTIGDGQCSIQKGGGTLGNNSHNLWHFTAVAEL